MRVVIGAMKHESNTFTDLTTALEPFRPVRGTDVYERDDWEHSATAGITDVLEQRGHDIIPTQFAHALPSGVIETDAHHELRDGILEGLRVANDIDAVCLDLHGSMYADDESDPEGALLEAVRDEVGPDVPVVCSLDMHATVTERMVEAADGFVAYRTAPHTDVYETGERAAELLCRIAESDRDAVVERIHIPMLLCGEQSETDAEPMASLIDALWDADKREGVYEASLLLGFPWADSPYGGCYAVVTGRAGSDGARKAAEALAADFWDVHDEFDFTTEARELDAAIDAALNHDGAPVIVSDAGDNPMAGATEDLTVVDARLRERDVEDALVALIVDAESRAAAAEAGEGSDVVLELGRAEYADDAAPLSLDTTVQTVDEPRGTPAAVVSADGVDTVVVDERTAVYDPALLEELGHPADDYELVFVKSGYQSPAFQSIADRSMLALTPGDTNLSLAELPYDRVPRPIYPVDEPDFSV
jgi:microcystin degradation protein MlrC